VFLDKPINNHRYTPWIFQGLNKFAKKDELKFLEEKKRQSRLLSSGGPPCVDDVGFNTYYNRADVKKALNVRADITFEVCSDDVGNNYEQDHEKGSFFLYPKLVKSGIKILKYSGDTDSVVPFNGTEKWIKKLNLPILEKWRSWTTADPLNIGGYVTKYDGLTFITVRGAGHMVPQFRPKESFYFLTQYLSGKDY